MQPNRRIPGALAALTVCLAATPAAALQRVYVANITAGTVAVLDADRRAVTDVIPVGAEPDGLAVRADGTAVYVANFRSNSLSVIDTATDTVGITIAIGAGPVGVAVSPDDAEVWVANKTGGSLSVIDARTATVSATIPIGPDEGPNALAFTPDGNRVLVTHSFTNQVSVIDTATRQVTGTIPVDGVPNRVAVGADGGRAFVTTFAAGHLVVLDLSSLTVLSDVPLPSASLTGVALSPDRRTLFLVSNVALFRLDAASLDLLGDIALAPGASGVAALGGGPVIVANMPLSEVAFIDPAVVRPDAATLPMPPPYPRVSVFGGPFAVAALPQRDQPPLTVSIDAPLYDAKLDPHDELDVRITVADGTAALTAWTLTLRALDGAPGERVLASGNEPVAGTAVASIASGEVRAGTLYELRLSALGDAGTVVRRLRFSVPDRRYTLVPLEPTHARRLAAPFAMDAAGEHFVRWNATNLDFDTYDASTGADDSYAPPLSLTSVGTLQLSRDGRRLVLHGRGAVNGLQVVDLASRLVTVLPYSPGWFDIDAKGRWLAGTDFVFSHDRYQMLDTIGGVRLRISDVVHLNEQDPTICRPFEGNRPRVSADGNLVTFGTGLDFGFAAARGCNIFAYDRAAQQVRLVAVLGDTRLAEPSLDDTGQRMGIVLSDTDAGDFLNARAMLVDLASGALQDILGDHPEASYDAALLGEGSGVVISSCADLDASVGNADRNQELFLYDLAAGTYHQITDTRGGTVGCDRRGGSPFRPTVSRDGRVLSFVTPVDPSGGPARTWRNGLAFAAVRAVPVDAADQPPGLTVPDRVRVLVDEAVDFTGAADDPDSDAIALFAELDERAESPIIFTRRGRTQPTFRVTWISRGADDAGEHVVRIGAFDGRGGEAVREVPVAVCRLFVDAAPVAGVIASIFAPLPAACGSADANGDGVVSAADVLAAAASAAR